jgi:hypothetical protein
MNAIRFTGDSRVRQIQIRFGGDEHCCRPVDEGPAGQRRWRLGGLALLVAMAGMMPVSFAATAAEADHWTLATDDTELRVAVGNGWPTVQGLGVPGEKT